jgi:hypothetical protein
MIIKKWRGRTAITGIIILLTSYSSTAFGVSSTPAKSPAQKQLPPVAISVYSPQKVRLTNVRDTQFTVSWITNGITRGRINYGQTPRLGKIARDDRGANAAGRIHHITVKHLNPNTLYYFQIISGGKIYKNGKKLYACRTGPTIIPAECDVAYGRIYRKITNRRHVPYGPEAVIYLTIVNKDTSGGGGESAPESVLLDKKGYWSCELANIREKGLAELFDYSDAGDALKVEVETGIFPAAGVKIDTADDSPVKNIEIPQSKLQGR